MYPIKYMSLYVFMKLTTRSTNIAFIGYYEFTADYKLQCNLDCIVIYIYSYEFVIVSL
jgi:hypothetical protein